MATRMNFGVNAVSFLSSSLPLPVQDAVEEGIRGCQDIRTIADKTAERTDIQNIQLSMGDLSNANGPSDASDAGCEAAAVLLGPSVDSAPPSPAPPSSPRPLNNDDSPGGYAEPCTQDKEQGLDEQDGGENASASSALQSVSPLFLSPAPTSPGRGLPTSCTHTPPRMTRQRGSPPRSAPSREHRMRTALAKLISDKDGLRHSLRQLCNLAEHTQRVRRVCAPSSSPPEVKKAVALSKRQSTRSSKNKGAAAAGNTPLSFSAFVLSASPINTASSSVFRWPEHRTRVASDAPDFFDYSESALDFSESGSGFRSSPPTPSRLLRGSRTAVRTTMETRSKRKEAAMIMETRSKKREQVVTAVTRKGRKVTNIKMAKSAMRMRMTRMRRRMMTRTRAAATEGSSFAKRAAGNGSVAALNGSTEMLITKNRHGAKHATSPKHSSSSFPGSSSLLPSSPSASSFQVPAPSVTTRAAWALFLSSPSSSPSSSSSSSSSSAKISSPPSKTTTKRRRILSKGPLVRRLERELRGAKLRPAQPRDPSLALAC